MLTGMLVNFRSHLLSVPSRIAPLILNESDINVIIRRLEKEMLDTLDELSEYDPDKINKESGIDFDEDESDEDEDGESEDGDDMSGAV